MKILVLAEKYSTKSQVSQGFIHTRNREYLKKDIVVDVISFAYEGENYRLDDVKVYSLKEFYKKKKVEDYDAVISHAPNIRHHCKFINENYDNIKKIIFFFHGHEVLYCKEIYPKPYDFVKKENRAKEFVRNLYDIYKIQYISHFFKSKLEKSTYIFVSEWMYDQFKKNIKINEILYKDKSHIIYNALGEIFINNSYDRKSEKEYDFITIRNMLDGSKYCIDVVTELARNNPEQNFLVIGKGEFFNYNKAPDNLTYILENLNHEQIIEYLNKSRYALMPTRADAQGVMMCEMATFGIPVITSDIPVCKMVLGDVENVSFINNEKTDIDLKNFSQQKEDNSKKNDKFSYDNTILKEIKIIEGVCYKYGKK